MARRVYADFDANLDQRLGNRTDVSSAQRGHWLNDALLLVANEFMHPELQGKVTESLGIDSDTLTPTATDIWWPDMLRNAGTGLPIIMRPKEEIEGILVKPSMSPTRFHWWGGLFYFDAKPTAILSLTLWYWKQPAEWSSGSPVLNKIYDPILELYSAMVAHQFLREFDKAHMAEVEANNYASKMHLPVREVKKNDYMAGISVRTR